MGINKFNSEGYFDPTAYQALVTIEREAGDRYGYRPIVYICSPLSGDIEGNQAKARDYCRFAVREGYIPLAPHLLFPQFLNDTDPNDRGLAIFMDLVLLTKCNELWVFGDSPSAGMRLEMTKARRKGLKIRRFSEGCKEVTA